MEKKLERCEPVQDPIVLIGEQFKIPFALENNEQFKGFITEVGIGYEDASGREYEQVFCITVRNDGFGYVTNYAKPVLKKDIY